MADVAIKLNDLSANDRKNLVGGTSGASASTRIQIVPATPKTLSHLPSRPAVELAFRDLAYRVKEGRSNSEYSSIMAILIVYSAQARMDGRSLWRASCFSQLQKLFPSRARSSNDFEMATTKVDALISSERDSSFPT
jgi:hypothetical protein